MNAGGLEFHDSECQASEALTSRRLDAGKRTCCIGKLKLCFWQMVVHCSLSRSLVELKCAPIDIQVLLFLAQVLNNFVALRKSQTSAIRLGGEIHDISLDEFVH